MIDICADILFSLENPVLKRNNFVSLMKFATEEVEFSFNNVLYRQIDSIAIGSSLSIIKTGYPLIYTVFKTETNRLNYTKSYGPEKSPVLFILSYAGEKLTQIERNIKKCGKIMSCCHT